MVKAPPSPRKATAPKPSPAPATAPVQSETAAAPEQAGETPGSTSTGKAVVDQAAQADAIAEEAVELGAPVVAIKEPLDARHELLGNAERAVRAALDALDEVTRSGVFFAETAADKLIVATAQQGFDAMRKAMLDTEAAVRVAIETLRYEGLERRAFVVVADVQLDGTHYGPSSAEPEKPAPLTADQHAELAAVGVIEADWEAGAPVEAD